MESQRNLSTAVGFCVLPSELIHNILLHLALPEIVRLKSVSKSIAAIISDHDFIRQCNLRSRFSNWIFVCKKRWRRDSILQGFADGSDRWFKIPVADHLISASCPREDLYFLAASGNFFLFASNTSQEVISVNFMTKTVKKIPPTPLVPRGMSSWRRSGMKLVSGSTSSDRFRFMFVELHENHPVLYEYDSQTDNWRSMEAQENTENLPSVHKRGEHLIFLHAMNGHNESTIIAVGSNSGDDAPPPVVSRPRFDGEGNEEHQLVSWDSMFDRFRVYGDGNMMIVRSMGDQNPRVWTLSGIEVWGMSLNGRCWEYMTRVPSELIEQIKKPYGVMKGCLEEREGIIRVVLMSNYEGLWDIIWLCYEKRKCQWSWVPVPDCNMKGQNMAGIAFSSGLALS
ncbi:hypothetical protein L1049_001130 [Liquidambar formosana]|uniref:F-box domain-containing protein n=1 Tax=Liquidambar formosana TaxID=63359 RepID=A0AAP0NE43_LIQFO